jgi:hypothetical protein
LNLDTKLSLPDVFAAITGVWSAQLTLYGFRSLKLLPEKSAPRCRPVGWTKLGAVSRLWLFKMLIHFPHFCGGNYLNMSSTPKGVSWRLALFAFIEDAWRHRRTRWDRLSPISHDEIRSERAIYAHGVDLAWLWGFGFISIAIVETVLVMVLTENIGFGVGWRLAYAWAAG